MSSNAIVPFKGTLFAMSKRTIAWSELRSLCYEISVSLLIDI